MVVPLGCLIAESSLANPCTLQFAITAQGYHHLQLANFFARAMNGRVMQVCFDPLAAGDKENHDMHRHQRSSRDKDKQQQRQQQQHGNVLKSPAPSGGALRLPLSPHQGSIPTASLAQEHKEMAEVTRLASERAVGGNGQGEGFRGDMIREVRRLLAEKAELLASGLYTREDFVIQQLDRRVQQLAEAN
jgi:hypothetical protein